MNNSFAGFWRDGAVMKPEENHWKKRRIVARWKDSEWYEVLSDRFSNWHQVYWLDTTTTEVTSSKPDPGEGWRLLEPCEDVEKGDEYYSHANKAWLQSGSPKTCGGKQGDFPYRRRITPQYIPYTWDDRDELRGRWLKSKRPPHCEFIVLEFKSMSGTHLRVNGIDAVALLNDYEWLDGTPCGKKVV